MTRKKITHVRQPTKKRKATSNKRKADDTPVEPPTPKKQKVQEPSLSEEEEYSVVKPLPLLLQKKPKTYTAKKVLPRPEPIVVDVPSPDVVLEEPAKDLDVVGDAGDKEPAEKGMISEWINHLGIRDLFKIAPIFTVRF